MREHLVEGYRSLNIKVVLSMRSKRFLLDDSRPFRVLIWRVALNKGSLNLARLSSASLKHKDIRQGNFQDGRRYQLPQISPPLFLQLRI
jgi:hypothetical protein